MPVLDSFSLAGRTALITGGSRGIGRGLAGALGEAGARVALTATTIEAARSAADDLRALGLDAHGYELDVTDREQVDDVVAQVGHEGGGVDVLVNNAGISIGGAALEIEDDVWHRTLATNLDGVWYCSRAVARQMVEDGRGGTIVNVGSMSAQIVNRPRWQPAYLASKAAVHQLTKGLAAEWAPHGIRVNAIAPGYILTEASPVDQPEYYDDCVAPAAMQRWGTPAELGPVVVMLASDASSFMTGAVVTVDGGYTLF